MADISLEFTFTPDITWGNILMHSESVVDWRGFTYLAYVTGEDAPANTKNPVIVKLDPNNSYAKVGSEIDPENSDFPGQCKLIRYSVNDQMYFFYSQRSAGNIRNVKIKTYNESLIASAPDIVLNTGDQLTYCREVDGLIYFIVYDSVTEVTSLYTFNGATVSLQHTFPIGEKGQVLMKNTGTNPLLGMANGLDGDFGGGLAVYNGSNWQFFDSINFWLDFIKHLDKSWAFLKRFSSAEEDSLSLARAESTGNLSFVLISADCRSIQNPSTVIKPWLRSQIILGSIFDIRGSLMRDSINAYVISRGDTNPASDVEKVYEIDLDADTVGGTTPNVVLSEVFTIPTNYRHSVWITDEGSKCWIPTSNGIDIRVYKLTKANPCVISFQNPQVSTTNETESLNDGTITVNVNTSGSIGPVQYRLLDAAFLEVVTWQASNIFIGLAPGTYYVEVRDLGVVGCQIQSQIIGILENVTEPEEQNPARSRDFTNSFNFTRFYRIFGMTLQDFQSLEGELPFPIDVAQEISPPVIPDLRVTPAGDTRVTPSGDERSLP